MTRRDRIRSLPEQQSTTPTTPQRCPHCGGPAHPRPMARWIEQQQQRAADQSSAWTRAAVSVTGGTIA